MNGYLDDELYKQVTANVPIACVDIIPVRQKESWEVGVLIRATGSQKGKQTILGGRIYHSETIDQAITRHIETDLGIKSFSHFKNFSAEHPFMVQQYFMESSTVNEEFGFDPTKHAVTPTYLVEINEAEISPKNEAAEFLWVQTKIEDLSLAGYNQHVVINKSLDYLNNL